VGESEHFRLYVDSTLTPLPEAFAGENALAALETNWSDFATMLKMPDGKITYYLYASGHIIDACDGAHVGGCTKEEDMEIDAPLLPDAHELTHAYTYLRLPRRPIPFLAEGSARLRRGADRQPPAGRLAERRRRHPVRRGVRQGRPAGAAADPPPRDRRVPPLLRAVAGAA
jgi:hypothetical protein